MRRLLALLLLTLVARSAPAFNLTDLTLPGIVGAGCNGPSGTANQMFCVRMPAWAGGTFTSIAGQMTQGIAGATCGFAIYPDADGSAALFSASAACTGPGPISASSLPSQSIVAGTIYRMCFCSTSTQSAANSTCNGTGVAFLVTNDTGTGTGHLAQLATTFVTTTFAHAATACSAGVPPAAGTGALSNDLGVKGAPFLQFH